MKRALLLLALCVLFAPAAATAASNPQMTALQHQVRTLASQVKSLNGQVVSLKSQVRKTKSEVGSTAETVAGFDSSFTKLSNFSFCENAIVFDVLHAYFHVMAIGFGFADQVFTPLDDGGACTALGVTRTPQSLRSSPPGLGSIVAADNALIAQAVLGVR